MDYRESISIVNGDIVFDRLGKIKTVSMEQKLMQSILLKIRTIKGDLFYSDEYGLDIYGLRKIDRETLEAKLKEAVVDNEVIIDLRLINFNIDENNLGVASAEMEILLMEGDTLIIEVEDNDTQDAEDL